MKYLITGGSGFLGQYIVAELQSKGNTVYTATRNPKMPNDIFADLSKCILEFPDSMEENQYINGFAFDYLIHAAGKAHIIPKTEEDTRAFYDTNVKGTKFLLEKVSNLAQLPKAIVFISSVSVYGIDSGTDITEQSPLTATDPYGKSKIEAEQLLVDWGKKNKVAIGIARLPLIAGFQAPGNLNKMLKGIKSGKYFRIGKGDARKSMVWAGDIAAILPVLAEKGGIYNFTDGMSPTFAELENAITQELNLKTVKKMPLFVAKIAALSGTVIENITGKKMPVNNRILAKITSPLTFSDKKARELLNWNPSPVLSHIKEITA